LAEAEVSAPSREIARQFLDDLREAFAAASRTLALNGAGRRSPPCGRRSTAASTRVCADAGIRQELGYQEHIDQAEAFRRTVAWERDHFPEKIDPEWFDYAAEDKALSR